MITFQAVSARPVQPLLYTRPVDWMHIPGFRVSLQVRRPVLTTSLVVDGSRTLMWRASIASFASLAPLRHRCTATVYHIAVSTVYPLRLRTACANPAPHAPGANGAAPRRTGNSIQHMHMCISFAISRDQWPTGVIRSRHWPRWGSRQCLVVQSIAVSAGTPYPGTPPLSIVHRPQPGRNSWEQQVTVHVK